MALILECLFAIPLAGVAALLLVTAVRRFLLPCHPDMDFMYLLAQTTARLFVACFYRARVTGVENIPETGGALLIANHVSYADVPLLGLYSKRPIRFMSWEGFERNFATRVLMRTFKTIPVSPNKAKDAIRRATERLKAGEVVAIFPEGQLTRSGSLNTFRPGYELIARLSGATIVPAHVDGMWGSVFSHRGGKPFCKLPEVFRPRAVSIRYGAPLTDTTPPAVRRALLDMGAASFALRPELNISLAESAVRAACARPGAVAVVDRAAGRSAMTSARLLAAARVYADRLREIAPERRVGIILPPGIPGMVANLACALAGKTPVNLNYTLGRAALEHCFRKAGIRTVITVGAFREKISEKLDVPWPENTSDILVDLKRISKPRVLAAEAALRLLPARAVVALWGVPRAGGDTEASILFTSGSSGTPKGVVLTHRNILANAEQIAECGIVPPTGSLLANLPIFHSFGHTVTVWFAFTRSIRCVCLPSPLEPKRNAEVIREEGVTCVIGTPTFLRNYFNRVNPADLASLRSAVAGAERTPPGFAAEWERTFGAPYFEGYGATETSPVVSVNVPGSPDPEAPGGSRPGSKPGSVGRLVAGMSARILHPDTGEELGFDATGLLVLRGANVFPGYLDDAERTAEALKGGWYHTGDLARMDSEGFIVIEGRLSRFSKIGGEMVPHGAIEEAIFRAFELPFEGGPRIAVSSRNDEKKGESLVLLSAVDLDLDEVRRRLSAAGLANLWIPRILVRVERIPVLLTGKLDLQALKEIAAGE